MESPVSSLTILGTGEPVALAECRAAAWSGTTLYAAPDGRWLAPAFRGTAVAVAAGDLPDPDDEDAAADLILTWVDAVRAHDWSDLRGSRIEDDGDWVDLRAAMVRVGWGPTGAQAAWEACRARPYSRALPTAAGWAGGGWVVPADATSAPAPAFARPVLEARGLLRWTYIDRWATPPPLPDTALPTEPDPDDLGWADVLSRLRQDHHTGESLEECVQVAVEVLGRAGLGPRSAIEAEDEPLPDADVTPATTHPSPLVRAAAWFLLREEADAWLACSYGECQHHWAVEAEEDAYELDEVLELAGYGVANPVDAAYQRRRLLTQAFGDVNDVPLAGAGDVETFVSFYESWVAAGRLEEDFQRAVEDLRGGP